MAEAAATDPAAARKRRKEIMQNLRAEKVAQDSIPVATAPLVEAASVAAKMPEVEKPPPPTPPPPPPPPAAAAEVPASSSGVSSTIASSMKEEALPPKKRKVSIKKSTPPVNGAAEKKTQIRYDPDVPMDKEQLAAWRREARRVRNRESAAASRQRIRNRITELEEEVDEWKSKFAQAMERLQQLEQLNAANRRNNGNGEETRDL